MSFTSQLLTPKELLEDDEAFNDIAELLERKGLEFTKNGSSIAYRGERFHYFFMYGTVVQREYDKSASADDFKAWKTVYPLVEEDLTFPYHKNPELSYSKEE